MVEPQVFSLEKGEEKRIVFTTSKTSGSEEIMMYSGSARLREIMATILETEKGKFKDIYIYRRGDVFLSGFLSSVLHEGQDGLFLSQLSMHFAWKLCPHGSSRAS